jgi:multidrug resistance efflux pump
MATTTRNNTKVVVNRTELLKRLSLARKNSTFQRLYNEMQSEQREWEIASRKWVFHSDLMHSPVTREDVDAYLNGLSCTKNHADNIFGEDCGTWEEDVVESVSTVPRDWTKLAQLTKERDKATEERDKATEERDKATEERIKEIKERVKAIKQSIKATKERDKATKERALPRIDEATQAIADRWARAGVKTTVTENSTLWDFVESHCPELLPQR